MRRRAGFHPNQTRLKTRKKQEHLGPSKTLANNRLAIRIDGVNLKYSLGKINADCANLHGGRPLSMVALFMTTTLWHLDAAE
jgi:hypothetical protein